MNDLSEKEINLLKLYQKLSSSKPSKVNRLAVEVVPPIIFTVLGIITGNILFFVLVILLLVIFNVIKVIKQETNINLLKSISVKIVGDISSYESNDKT